MLSENWCKVFNINNLFIHRRFQRLSIQETRNAKLPANRKKANSSNDHYLRPRSKASVVSGTPLAIIRYMKNLLHDFLAETDLQSRFVFGLGLIIATAAIVACFF